MSFSVHREASHAYPYGRNQEWAATLYRVTVTPEPGRPAVDSETLAGRQLRRMREGRGWSRREVAERLEPFGYHWHQTVIAKIESAERPLRLNEALDLASVFGVPLTDLVMFTGGHGVDVERELASMRQALAGIEDQLAAAHRTADLAKGEISRLTAEAERLKSRIGLLSIWHPPQEEAG
jgi:transcriptional regulator with XRE-family HTH domain